MRILCDMLKVSLYANIGLTNEQQH